MSHQSQLDFVRSLTNRFPIYFAGQRVLEVGSLDINGSIRQFFSGCEYIGVDLGEDQKGEWTVYAISGTPLTTSNCAITPKLDVAYRIYKAE